MFRSLERINSKFEAITLDNSKNALLRYDDCSVCTKRISSKGFSVAINNGKISLESLMKSTVFILPGAREQVDLDEIVNLQKFVKRGGRLFVMDSCGKTSNINLLLNSYGIQFGRDTLIRSHRAKTYLHPCEALISDGVVNDSIFRYLTRDSDIRDSRTFPILYPFGCTLNVKQPSDVLFSSGSVCIPFRRPVCAFYQDPISGGRIFATGSAMMFSDSYIGKERNFRFFDLALDLLTIDAVYLNPVDAQCPDIWDYATIPCIAKLSDSPFCCLQTTGEELPELEDFHLFGEKLTQFDSRHLARVSKAYKELDVEKERLRIIKPKFEAPLPTVSPALIPPRFRDLPPPPLELMDLDEVFMSQALRLQRQTYKCDDKDLEFYIRKFAELVKLPKHLSAKDILYYICKELVVRKMSG